jgi:hypothetical protein
MMPWQLARSDRRRKSEPRAIVELTPHINVNDIRHIIPRNYSTYIYSNSFKYPFAKNLILSRQNIEFNHVSGYNQIVGIHWCRTGFGRPRPMFVCSDCCGGAYNLYFRHGHLACRYCHRIQYASRQHNQIARKRLQASKLRLQLGGLPNSGQPLPTKPKWKHHKTYRNVRTAIDRLEAPIKAYRFRKPLNTRLFAYHIG